MGIAACRGQLGSAPPGGVEQRPGGGPGGLGDAGVVVKAPRGHRAVVDQVDLPGAENPVNLTS
jgi:hypothetical protein